MSTSEPMDVTVADLVPATTDQVSPFVRLLTHKIDALRTQIVNKEAAVRRTKELDRNATRQTTFLDQDPDLDPDSGAVIAAVSELDEVSAATALNYSALERAVRAAQKGAVLIAALGLKPGEAKIKLDDEEKAYITDLLSDLKDLEMDVIQAEDQRINIDLKIMETMAEVQKKLHDLSEKNEAILAQEAAMAEDAPSSSGDTPVKAGASKAFGTPHREKQYKNVEAKKKALEQEERKVQQMRILIQRLLTVAMTQGADSESPNPLAEEENLRMLIRCGKTIDQLRAEEEGQENRSGN